MEGIEAAFAGGMVQETGIAGIVKARLVLLFTELDFQFEMVVAELFLGDDTAVDWSVDVEDGVVAVHFHGKGIALVHIVANLLYRVPLGLGLVARCLGCIVESVALVNPPLREVFVQKASPLGIGAQRKKHSKEKVNVLFHTNQNYFPARSNAVASASFQNVQSWLPSREMSSYFTPSRSSIPVNSSTWLGGQIPSLFPQSMIRDGKMA